MRCPRCSEMLVAEDYLYGITIDFKAYCYTCSNAMHLKRKAEKEKKRNKGYRKKGKSNKEELKEENQSGT